MHPNEGIGASDDRQFLHEAAPLLALWAVQQTVISGQLILFYLVSRLL